MARRNSMTVTSTKTKHGRGFRTKARVPFEQQMRNFKEKVGVNVELFMIMFGKEMAEELVYNTPFQTGWLRGSWLVGFHSNLRRQGSFDPSGTTTIAEMQMKVGTYKLGQKMYFVNSAVYSWYVEGGTHKMVGRFFVRRSVHNAPLIAQNIAQRISDR